MKNWLIKMKKIPNEGETAKDTGKRTHEIEKESYIRKSLEDAQ
jgi:hypothetical protein